MYQSAQQTDAALRSRLEGAAFEDIFGFGFWPRVLILLAVQTVVLTIAWLHLGKQPRWAVVVLLVVFLVAS